MNNEQLLAERWKPTDKLLRRLQRSISTYSKELKTNILDIFETTNITFSQLNKTILTKDYDRLTKLITEWEKAGITDNYVAYKISKRKKHPNYSEYLELMLLMTYSMYMNKVYKGSKETFKAISEDAVNKAKQEMNREPILPFILTWTLIEKYLIVTTLNMKLKAYLQLLCQYNWQEAYRLFVQTKQAPNSFKTTERAIADLLSKQQHRIININGDRESGVMVDVGREVWNRMYIEPYREENVQVRFIAEMDRATTKMCRSMDNMLFYTNDWNRYYRYSDMDGRDVLYTTFGLVTGENLPPINNHFHWCRSTITYMTDVPREDINRMLHPNDR